MMLYICWLIGLCYPTPRCNNSQLNLTVSYKSKSFLQDSDGRADRGGRDVQLLHDVLGGREGHDWAKHLLHKVKKLGIHQNLIVTQGTAHVVLGRPWPARTWRRPWKHTWPWSFRPVKDLIQVASWVPWLASISWNPAEAMHPMENHLEPISLTEKMLIGCLHGSKPVSSSAIVVTWSPKTPIELFISTSSGVV